MHAAGLDACLLFSSLVLIDGCVGVEGRFFLLIISYNHLSFSFLCFLVYILSPFVFTISFCAREIDLWLR